MTTNARSLVHRQTVRAVAAAMVFGLVVAGCGGTTNSATSTSPTTAASTATAPGSGLKKIDQGALQALVDTSIKDQLIPGAVVVLQTPQGNFIVASGTTELGMQSPPDADTHFRIASNTKTMTSAVVLQLAQEGKLSLDDPVSKYVLGVPNGDNITITELLKMRTGLYNYTNAPQMSTSLDDNPTKEWTPQELLDIAFAQPPNFAPDTEFEYSNTNYVLLGLIIEKVDGKPLAAAFQDRLFGPLGMTNTELPPGPTYTIPDPFTHGYLYGSSSVALFGEPDYTPEQIAAAEDGTLKPTDYTDVNHSFAFGAGNVISTANDLATWTKALVGGKVLDAEYQKLWLDSPQIEDPEKPGGLWYGYGITRQTWGSNTLIYHGGETAGYNSKMAVETTNDVTLVLWTNLTVDVDKEQQTANTLMLKILDQIMVQSPLAVTAADLAAPTTTG
ncbi:MAG: serine hydrolase domain-containing protein [Nakamurella sp.]